MAKMNSFSLFISLLLAVALTCGVSSTSTNSTPINPGQLGDSCNLEQEPCEPYFSECSNKICKCKEGYIQKDEVKDTCLEYATSLGEGCVVSEQCQNLGKGAVCRNYKCVCGNGAQPDREMVKCVEGPTKALIGKGCRKNEDCGGFNPLTPQESPVICRNSRICSCKEGFITSKDLDDCLPIVNLIGEQCWQDQQCQQGKIGFRSGCVEDSYGYKSCNCDGDTVSKNNLCYQKATEVGGFCSFQDQCTAYLGKSHCLNGRCVCLPGTTASADKKECL